MRNFTKKQIRDFEKVRLEAIKRIELFEAGVKFTSDNFIVVSNKFNRYTFSMEWIEELKSAINNINLTKSGIGGIKVDDFESKIKALKEYNSGIEDIIFKQRINYPEFPNQINGILEELIEQINNFISIELDRAIKKGEENGLKALKIAFSA